jgi:hypothetical protein
MSRSGGPSGRGGANDQGAIIQIVRIGKAAKATAIDPVTLVEVTVLGPANASDAILRELAMRRLQSVLRQKQ